MKTKLIGVILASLAMSTLAADLGPLAIIPQPQHIERSEGAFTLTADTRIYVDSASRKTGEYLARGLRQSTGYPFEVRRRLWSSSAVKHAIVLTTKHATASLGAEGYELTVSPDSVVIRAPKEAGVFYGVQSLLELLPPKIFSRTPVSGVDWQLPCVQISDRPRFKWRGLMLDVSRHFYSVAEVKRVLDLMALHKLNHFHWHLVDNDGWRIQIKRYPKLTQIGAWRPAIGYGLDPKSSTAYGPDGRYGGFYTQDQIRAVVAYAKALHITVVPEIEMPGHSLAALEAYPEFNCLQTNGTMARPIGVYCAGNDGTFTFLQNVLTEVFALFPSKYIHIGGDEVSKENWKTCPLCQARMKAEGLKNTEELQSYFVKRMEKFVNAHGHTLIGWSEILQGGLAQNAVVMDWIGGGKEAASEGHDVVMTPTGYCYFDYYQSPDHSLEPRAIGGYLPLRRVYSFEPIPSGLAPQFDSHILGAQANVWTEYIAATNHLEYMIFPRLCALAEVAWSPKASRNWDDFQRRLKVQEQRLDELGVNYRHDHSVEVGGWSPFQISTSNAALNWDVTAEIKAPGQFHVTLNYQHGNNGLNIAEVALLENGQEVARDTHGGFTGAQPRNPVYILKLSALKADAKYTLQADVAGSGGTDSYGTVSWVFVPSEPKVESEQ